MAEPLPPNKRAKHSHSPLGPSAPAAGDAEQIDAASDTDAPSAPTCPHPAPRVVQTFTLGRDEPATQIHVQIPEWSSSELGSFLWPSSLLLSDYIHHSLREQLQGQSVLELGAGRCLSGIHCALMGCGRVLLSDAVPSVLREAEQIVALNGLTSDRARVIHLRWGEFTPLTRDLRGQVHFIIGADVFYNGQDFEDVFATVSFFGVPFLTAYQHRGEGRRRFRTLCRKWRMDMRRIEWSFDTQPLQCQQRPMHAVDGASGASATSSDTDATAGSFPFTYASSEQQQQSHHSASLHENVTLELLLFTPRTHMDAAASAGAPA